MAPRPRAQHLLPITLLLLLAGGGSLQGLAPRQPLPSMPRNAEPSPGAQLFVKFTDEARVRLAREVLFSRTRADVRELQSLEARFGLRFRPWLELPEEELRRLEQRAARASGRMQPDLAGVFRVEVEPARLEPAAAALEASELVEFVYLREHTFSLAGDLAPVTPCALGAQRHLGEDPGLDAHYAWSHGARGQGLRLSDVEGGWNVEHEDFCGKVITPEPGVTLYTDIPFYTETVESHGTSALGVIAAVPQEYGMNGIAPEAELYTYGVFARVDGAMGPCCDEGFACELVPRFDEAIAAAIAASAPGDVVLLELQRAYRGEDCPLIIGDEDDFQGDPMEIDPMIWMLISCATDAGVLVVEPAGNGSQDLDGPGHQNEYDLWRARGDSGAILVGAGSSTMLHERLDFSSYGERLDVQGWGENVRTLGRGQDTPPQGPDPTDPRQWYTTTFAGTSSASAMVAGAVLAVQSYAVERFGAPLAPAAMRELLVSSGEGASPQGGDRSKPIGPFVSLRAAFEALGGLPDVSVITRPACTVEPDSRITFEVQVINNSTVPQSFEGWIRVTKPNGNPASPSPFLEPNGVTGFPPGAEARRQVPVRIPASATPAGPFAFTSFVGQFEPESVIHSSSFGLWIVPPLP